MRNWVSKDHMTEWSGIEGKEQRTSNWALGDSNREFKFGRAGNRPALSPDIWQSGKIQANQVPSGGNLKPAFQSTQEIWMVSGVEGSRKVEQSTRCDFAIMHGWQDITMDL